MPEPMDLDYIQNDLENEAEGLTPYWAEVVTYLLSETRQVQIANRSVRETQAEMERLYEVIKEAWRLWADVQDSVAGPTTLLDRGYVLLRVHPERWAAFDALFRASKILDKKE